MGKFLAYWFILFLFFQKFIEPGGSKVDHAAAAAKKNNVKAFFLDATSA